MGYEWRLRLVMAQAGMFKATDLTPRLAAHGIALSESQVWRLVTGKPERLNLQVLAVLCEILECQPGDLIVSMKAGPLVNPCVRSLTPQLTNCRVSAVVSSAMSKVTEVNSSGS